MRRTFIVVGSLLLLLPLVGAGALTARAQAIACDTPAQKASCQSQYDELQQEIAQQQLIITQTQAKKNTLKGNVTLLNAQIAAAEAQIKQKNLAISQLGAQIQAKAATIVQLSARIAAGKESLASMLRQESQLDDSSIVEVAFGDQDVSSFFADVDAFTTVGEKLQVLFAQIQTTQAQTETQKEQLAAQQNATQDAKFDIQTKQAQVAVNKTQQQQLLAITTNQESQYQKLLAANQAKAAQIRAALFPLRDAGAIQFGAALQYAQAAQRSTNVDPAFVLAILTQESNLGANVGQCYLTDDSTGSGVGKNTGTAFANVMNPTRDVPPFLALANQLGFDPHHQVVSCPIASAGGYGGAMGPGQFIASTWVGIASRVATARGKAVASPWDPQDAITAMSIFLGDKGALGGSYSAEHTAAAKYYAGGNWAGRQGQTYANQVMAKVASIQQNIDFLANN
jgi:peptidoglycan hydrolase CwlO-like protein